MNDLDTNIIPQKSDFSEYLMDPAHLENEEAEWARQQFYLRNAEAVKEFMDEHMAESVIEFGCGTGLVAHELIEYKYTGVDKNPSCIEKAIKKCLPFGLFYQMDVRDTSIIGSHDTACCFAFLKHFSIDEWDEILKIVLDHGRRALFAVAIADHDLDDGTEYPHASVTLEHLGRAVAAAGHKIIKTRHEADSATGYEMLVWTERV